jgi:hypothetical protein
MTQNNIDQLVAVAQELQTKREEHTEKLAQLPMPKAKVRKFPYSSMEEAIADKFALLDSASTEESDGMANAFRFLVKGYKTIAWRKAAEKNRETRDDIAEGNVPEVKKPRVRKPKAEAAKTEEVKG